MIHLQSCHTYKTYHFIKSKITNKELTDDKVEMLIQKLYMSFQVFPATMFNKVSATFSLFTD